MTESQALTLLAALTAAYPKHPFTPETAALYATKMKELDVEVARRTVESVIETSMWFPSVAELLEEYRRFWQWRPKQRELDAVKPTLEERQALGREMRQWATEHWGGPEPVANVTDGLEERSGGRCDDCAEDARERWRYGKFTLCHGCVTLRRRAVSSTGASTVSGPA